MLLDADTLVVEGVDALFDERATLAATFDSGFAEHLNTGVLAAPSAAGATFAELAARPVSFDGSDQGLWNA